MSETLQKVCFKNPYYRLKYLYNILTHETTYPDHPRTEITPNSVLYKHKRFKIHDTGYHLSKMNLSHFGLSRDPCLPAGPVICGWDTQTATTTSNALI